MAEPDLTPSFLPGLELARRFYLEAVRPLLDARFPGMRHSAALLGDGSEVLGLDDPRSTDHDWGPRLLIFVPDADIHSLRERMHALLADELPGIFLEFPTNFGPPDAGGTRLLEPVSAAPIAHRVEVHSVGAYMKAQLGFDPRGPVTVADWLSTSSQLLLSVTAGAVYHDGLDELEPLRVKLGWYPHDVWLYLLAAQWKRIGQEEAFVGRTAEVGDELGSRVVSARLVRDAMRLGFLLERRYAPYSKWLGKAFRALDCAAILTSDLLAVLAADEPRVRERHLSAVYEELARRHNALGLAPPVEPTVRHYHDRPYLVIRAERFVEATRAAITDPAVREIRFDAGSVDQFLDSTDVLGQPALARAAAHALYGEGTAGLSPRPK